MIWLRVMGFLRRVPSWAWVTVIALLALWLWGNLRERQGRLAERAKWQRVEAEMQAKADRLAVERLEAVSRAEEASRQAGEAIDALRERNKKQTEVFYATFPDRNVVCLAPERLRAIAEADQAAGNAATSGQRP